MDRASFGINRSRATLVRAEGAYRRRPCGPRRTRTCEMSWRGCRAGLSGLHRLKLLQIVGPRFRRHELRLGERRKVAAEAYELVERAGLDDVAVLEHQDARGIAHGR